MPRRPINLGKFTGQVPRDVEQAILRLRDAFEGLATQVEAQPSPLTLGEIQAALAPTGSNPLPLAGGLNTNPAPTTPPQPPQPDPGQTQAVDWADTTSDGVQVISFTGTPAVQFGSDPAIAIPAVGSFLDAVYTGAEHYAIVKGADGHAYLVERSTLMVTDLGLTYGNYPVGLRTDGTPIIQDSATTYTVGGVSTAIPAPVQGTTFGFLQLDALGDPVWTYYQISGGFPIVINGVTFALSSTEGDWVIGVSVLFPTQYLAYRISTDVTYFAGPTLNTTAAPRLTVLGDGSAVISRSLPAGFLPSAGYTVYDPLSPPTTPPNEPPVIFPPNNPPAAGAVDMINASLAVFENNPTGIESWTKSTEITQLVIDANGINAAFDLKQGANRWPDVRPPGWDGDLQYTMGLCYFIGGVWVCSASIQCWFGSLLGGPPSLYTQNWFYDAIRWPQLSGHFPIVGELVAFFVAEGNVRNETAASSDQYPLEERSNIVTFNLPSDAGGTFNF